jgi:hypothetical protein
MTRIASSKIAGLVALLIAASQGLAPEARAGTLPNTLSSNGLSANGLASNGLTANGLTANGLASNGVSSIGIRCCNTLTKRGFANRDSAADPNRLRLRAIVLPGETVAVAAE